MSLSGKKVLLLSPEFFGYGREIARELERLGAHVAAFDTRPDNSTLTKIGLRIAPSFVQAKSLTYHQNLMQSDQPDFDYILVIRGEGLTPEIVRAYRNRFNQAQLVYYTYDAVAENRLFLDFRGLFDRYFSFDPLDAKTYAELIYEPLFYIRKYAEVNNIPLESRTLDVSFVGTFRADRYQSIQKIISMLPTGLKTYFFFYHANQTFFKTLRLFSRQYRQVDSGLVHFQSISAQEVSSILERSKAVIDVQKPHQNGLTIRTIEMLGAQRKLITTNPWVREHNFYDPQNIFLVDAYTKTIPIEFFSTPYQAVQENLYIQYSLSAWLTRVLC